MLWYSFSYLLLISMQTHLEFHSKPAGCNFHQFVMVSVLNMHSASFSLNLSEPVLYCL